jgi:hypothetical protein
MVRKETSVRVMTRSLKEIEPGDTAVARKGDGAGTEPMASAGRSGDGAYGERGTERGRSLWRARNIPLRGQRVG